MNGCFIGNNSTSVQGVSVMLLYMADSSVSNFFGVWTHLIFFGVWTDLVSVSFLPESSINKLLMCARGNVLEKP